MFALKGTLAGAALAVAMAAGAASEANALVFTSEIKLGGGADGVGFITTDFDANVPFATSGPPTAFTFSYDGQIWGLGDLLGDVNDVSTGAFGNLLSFSLFALNSAGATLGIVYQVPPTGNLYQITVAGVTVAEGNDVLLPEPMSIQLLGAGLIGLALWRRRQKVS